ncbi:GlsB/YeaQ/YmgE family stress response membrane protein [Salinarimonas sp.]|uniref:GlsB/YeaQ/YmgE family stress response membrane protein n=1 Tax=Salinarimonas sp. TaxID=2766526 RepID=UPI0032D8C4F8
MSIIAWIVVGIIAGFIAEKVTGRNHGLLTNLIVGIIGAFVGGFLASLLGFEYAEGFNLASIIVATIGAIVFLWILGMIQGRRSSR